MASSGSSRRHEPVPLDELARRVREARAAVDAQRCGPVPRGGETSARHDLLTALESYVTALEAQHLPVPPRMRTELQIVRNLFGR